MRKSDLTAAALTLVALTAAMGAGHAAQHGTPLVTVTLPQTLTPREQIGERAFTAVCATCHGTRADGREGKGPPLIHRIYEPGHHADEAFQRAVAHGARSHHWPFGDMAPVPGLTRADVAAITAWVRAVQRENGID